jgi:glutamyl-tRNA reductase
MGRLVAVACRARGIPLVVASRTERRAADLAARVGAASWPFTPPSADLQRLGGIVVALDGPWPLDDAQADAVLASGAWLVDLSAPSATPGRIARELGDRFVHVDDLALAPAVDPVASRVTERLDRLINATLEAHERWLADVPRRTAARALAARAEQARDAELEALFARLASLDEREREAVAQMAGRLTERLLRDPLEKLRGDVDGRHGRAARELFGL